MPHIQTKTALQHAQSALAKALLPLLPSVTPTQYAQLEDALDDFVKAHMDTREDENASRAADQRDY